MGRKCDERKELAMEALYQIMKTQNILKRPAPTSQLFYLVENAINLWKDDPNYWVKVNSSAEKRNCRNLLQTISTWFDRRRNKTKANDTLKSETLAEWKKDIQIKKLRVEINNDKYNIGNNTTQYDNKMKRKREENISLMGLYDQFQELKKENEILKREVATLKKRCYRSNSFEMFNTDFCIESNNGTWEKSINDTNTSQQEGNNLNEGPTEHVRKLSMGDIPVSKGINNINNSQQEGNTLNVGPSEHERKLSMGHIPVLHKSSTCTPHLDYMANGTLDCQHKAAKCCEEGTDTYAFLGKDMSLDEIAKLLE